MDLWVRTQDNRTLIKTSCIKIDFDEIYDIDENDNEVLLGNYKSEERALEVLDDITQHIATVNSFALWRNPNTNDYTGGFCAGVFQMPEE